MYVPHDFQKTFSDAPFLNADLIDKNHELVKIANTIDWFTIGDRFEKFYSTNNGRPSKTLRLMLGIHLVKHLYFLSDEECKKALASNVYIQFLCDISIMEAHNAFNSSSLSRFRSRIGEEGAAILEDEIFSILKKHKLIRGRTAIFDTTCVANPIDYPTDIKLLERCRLECLSLINKAKSFGINFNFRTYARTARKVFLSFQHFRKHSKEQRRKTQKKLLQFLKRNSTQLQIVIQQLERTCSDEAFMLLLLAQQKLKVIQNIFEQQKALYHHTSVKDRIVSLWAPHIRPIVRGKFPSKTEFGPKILLELKGRFLFFSKLFFDNIADSDMMQDAIESYTLRHGHIPSEVGTDRGFWAPANVEYLKELGVKHIAVQTRRKKKPPDTAWQRRLRRRRCSIEAKISLGKRRYGLRRLNYRIRHGEAIWIRLSLATMNLHQAVKYCLN